MDALLEYGRAVGRTMGGALSGKRLVGLGSWLHWLAPRGRLVGLPVRSPLLSKLAASAPQRRRACLCLGQGEDVSTCDWLRNIVILL